jgi:hypothetical protein
LASSSFLKKFEETGGTFADVCLSKKEISAGLSRDFANDLIDGKEVVLRGNGHTVSHTEGNLRAVNLEN